MTSTVEAGSLKRGVLLLKMLATAGRRGLPLTDVSAGAGLPHPSVHRVLKQLVAERLVEHDPDTHRYRLGPLTFELGLAGSTMFDIRDLCESAMQRLAQSTGDTVYLVARSGFDAVCVHRLEGSFPIRTLVLEVGSRRPLGVGAGGLAILAMIDDEERAEVIERVGPNLPAFGGLSAASVGQACKKARSFGASVIQDTVNLGVSAVGRAFRDALGQPTAALSVAAMSQRMTSTRLRQIASELEGACNEVEERLRSQRQRGRWGGRG
jgi:DNA-binding IclR family transcriptional regulator